MPDPTNAVLEYLGLPLYDADFLKLIVKFGIDLTILTLVVRFVYYKRSRSKDYFFTFYMLNVIVFFICFALKKLDLQLGAAMGLFAIFGVLRYRTDALPVREMTYLFIVIGIAVVNALANRQVSWTELAFINFAFAGMPSFLESLPLLRQECSEDILYERIELVRPENHALLVDDLQQRTGLKISRIELGRIDLLHDVVRITVFYYPHEQIAQNDSGIDVTRRADRF